VPRVTDDRPLGDAIEALAGEILAGALDDAIRPHLGAGDLP